MNDVVFYVYKMCIGKMWTVDDSADMRNRFNEYSDGIINGSITLSHIKWLDLIEKREKTKIYDDFNDVYGNYFGKFVNSLLNTLIMLSILQ